MPEIEASRRGQIARYFRTLGPKKLALLFVEDWGGLLVRSIPGIVGFGLRYLLCRLVFERLGGLCFIYPGARLTQCYGIRAGTDLRVNSGVFIDARGGLTIGDDVLIGPNVVIVTSSHDWMQPGLPIVAQPHPPVPVTIGNDVWIGGNAVIMPGVNVATGTVVGAGAVVTADTEPYSIVAGVPARTIGMRPGAA